MLCCRYSYLYNSRGTAFLYHHPMGLRKIEPRALVVASSNDHNNTSSFVQVFNRCRVPHSYITDISKLRVLQIPRLASNDLLLCLLGRSRLTSNRGSTRQSNTSCWRRDWRCPKHPSLQARDCKCRCHYSREAACCGEFRNLWYAGCQSKGFLPDLLIVFRNDSRRVPSIWLWRSHSIGKYMVSVQF